MKILHCNNTELLYTLIDNGFIIYIDKKTKNKLVEDDEAELIDEFIRSRDHSLTKDYSLEDYNDPTQ